MRKALFSLGLVVTALVALGLVVLSSAGEANGIKIYSDPYFFLKRQVLYLLAGLVIVAVTAAVDYRIWRTRPWLLWLGIGIVFLLLLAVFPPFGRKINGSYRWINLGPVNLQPSEFAKLMTVISVSYLLDQAGVKVGTFRRGILYPGMAMSLLAAPILFETDFGSVAVIGMIGILLMLVAGSGFWWWLGMVGGGIGVVGAKLLCDKNRMARIAAWLGIKVGVGVEVLDTAAENAKYQADMALIAIKNGGISGRGLGESMQKWLYLPEAHTDCIFAVGAEELGLAFSVSVALLFVAFFGLSVFIALRASDRFGRYLVVGMAFIVFFGAMFNLAVVCGVLPTKGVALPFFSYGGTNLMCAFFAVGTILSVGIHSSRERERRRMRLNVRG